MATRQLGVFCGPSLPVADRTVRQGVTYLPPASRGDVERNVALFDALLLIDGVFHHDLAPSPKEVYAACRAIPMFGASSMGALRAVECRPYGMVPLGIIARWYGSELIDGDDEVAQLVHPQTQLGLTVPLVNVRYVAWLARRRAILSKEAAAEMVTRSREVFYMDRTWDDVVACVPESVRLAVRQLAETLGDLKRWDARFALKTTARRLGLLARLADSLN